MSRAHAAVRNAWDRWAEVPAAITIRAFTNREHGQDFTPESVRRVRSRVCEVLDIDTAAADALPLSRLAEVLRTPYAAGEPAGEPREEFRRRKVTPVGRLFALNAGQVSKLCEAGTFVTNGKTGPERRLDVLSVVRRELGRLARHAYPEHAPGSP